MREEESGKQKTRGKTEIKNSGDKKTWKGKECERNEGLTGFFLVLRGSLAALLSVRAR